MKVIGWPVPALLPGIYLLPDHPLYRTWFTLPGAPLVHVDVRPAFA